MKNVKTARGKSLDMGALAKKYEETRAVGNVAMNARGDRLDSTGKVKQTVQSVSRVQHEVAQPPQEQALSSTVAPSEPNAPVTGEPQATVMREIVREREDGSQYIEIEYSDGSMDTKEIGGTDEGN